MTTLHIKRILYNTDNVVKLIRDIPLDNITSIMPVCYDKNANPCAGIVINYTNGLNDVFYDDKQGVLTLSYI